MARYGQVWSLCAALLGLAGPAFAALPSSGCGQPAPSPPPVTFTVDGVERHAIVVVPKEYRSDQPVPLVFAFHGRTNNNAKLRRYLELEQAATAPMIFVYPQARRDRTGGFTWATTDDSGPDLDLFDQILTELGRAYCIDRSRVFAVGHSLGASFANSLACARPAAIAGVATVAGGISLRRCAGRVAGLLLHNPEDELVPIAEGEQARDTLLGISMAAISPVDVTLQGFSCQQAGDEAAPLVWCVHRQDFTSKGRYYPHQWPRGATSLIISFFDGLPPR